MALVEQLRAVASRGYTPRGGTSAAEWMLAAANEIEKLRAALKDVIAVAEGGNDWTHEALERIKAAKAALVDGQ